MVVNVVMKIGRMRLTTLVRTATKSGMRSPLAPYRSGSSKFNDCSTMRMALFTTVPMSTTNPSIVTTSNCCGALVGSCRVAQCTSASPAKPPTTASGTLNMITNG